MKITISKRIENHGKSITKEIVVECPDSASVFDIEDAMLSAMDGGAWITPENGAPTVEEIR